uniref:Uncharacterized protein n=1 Tax=Candidatus Kentrum sp. SD TaxID=2126332 RepID=A0A450YF30_9GAMM|nr:MAG: hypothetical protein BECKSD772F_GA0070984_105421 [Candidatus Kentron sp. SD]VFK45491.1 MAG: hypothetical protein BECKSD772E_GA0070983_105421 [Candidatus Kentron sp. SD]VFK77955.1 MAG: hypothetical protein BECKSD772D_GA0070982_100424 [Candidatus Kentron sp. SD]
MEIDKIKEEIGWLKVVFALLIAIGASLIGWAARNYQAPISLILLAGLAIALVILAIIEINRRAYGKIRKLGDM